MKMDIVCEMEINTSFGKPSGKLVVVNIDDTEVVFLPRHGPGHVHNPSEVNYRANIFALKSVGVNWIIGVSAVGSLREHIVPGEIVTVNQFIDRTFARKTTFFEDGIVAHVSMAAPVCEQLRALLNEACAEVKAKFHDGGVYINMEGPAFSTVAESELYRSWGASVIGMTVFTEAKLAREAEISYAVLAMATDYDCWRDGHDAVTVDQVVAVLQKNAGTAQAIVRKCVPKIVVLF
jgi:5'-methylthioadenosine phosphorylase